MPVVIPDEIRGDYLKYLGDEAKFRIPSRDPREFNVADHFFGNIFHAVISLEKLLSAVLPFPEPRIRLEEGVYTEFTVTGHAKVREAPGQQPDVQSLVGQSALMLRKGKEGTESVILQHIGSDYSSLVITSHLLRSGHHALLKYYPKMQSDLNDFADSVDAEIKQGGCGVSRETYNKLFDIQLRHGIIPTPLLASHYHGPRDLLPEIWGQFDVETFMKTELCNELYKGKGPDEIRRILQEMRELAMAGRDPFQVVLDADGLTLTENLPLYAHRVSQLLKMFSPRGKFYDAVSGRKVNFVGHSSNIDIISAYFRHFAEPSRLVLEKADKAKTRGAEVAIKVDRDFVYLNDPDKFQPLLEQQTQKMQERRNYSLDEQVRMGKGIVSTPLFALRQVQEHDERVSITLDNIIDYSGQPTLVLGDGGQGKTTLAIEIVKGINEGFAKGDNKIGIFIHCEDIQQQTRSVNEVGQYVAKFLEGLPNILLGVYQFVYVIDGLEALGSSYRDEVCKVAAKLAENGRNHVIVTSRYLGFNQGEGKNKGFKTVMIDVEAVARNIDNFLEGRLEPAKRKEFKDLIQPYGSPIRGTFQTLFFLLELYKHPDEVAMYLTNEDTLSAIRQGRALTEFQIRDATDDLMLGRYITTKPEYARAKGEPDQIKRIVLATKRHMDEMAFEQLTGQKPYHLESSKS
jgi:hypothetical protein